MGAEQIAEASEVKRGSEKQRNEGMQF